MCYFEVQEKKRGTRANDGASVRTPSVFPSFVLVFNDTWNDFTYRTWFCLYYYGEDHIQYQIGEVKIMRRNTVNTFSVLPSNFNTPLGEEYCSLGINLTYYKRLRTLFSYGEELKEVLSFLRDCAYFKSIREQFEDDEIFKTSLCRDLDSINALNTAGFVLANRQLNDAFCFKLHFAPNHLKGLYTDWKVDLEYEAPEYLRCVGLIGENGVGKTQILNCLVSNLIGNNNALEVVPLFDSCLALYSTPYDGYSSVDKPRIQFTSLCLEQNRVKTVKNLEDNLNKIIEHKTFHGEPMPKLYRESIEEALGDKIACVMEKKGDEGNEHWEINQDIINDRINILSSGQLQILLLITYIYANIHLSSLILIDEPEVHLHPHFINIFMQKLGVLLHQFDSYAIIATHSPLVVREMVSKNVYLMNLLEGGEPMIAKVNFETFGADAADLYRNIFDYDETSSLGYTIMKDLVQNFGHKIALEQLQKVAPKLSFNALLTLRDIDNL